jgi:uncharacterized protein (TIRG00374 family)
MEERAPLSALGRGRNWIGSLIALAVLLWVFFRLDWAAVFARIRTIEVGWYLVGMVGFYLGVPLRALRFELLFREAGRPAGVGLLSLTVLKAWFINSAIPGRMGDLWATYSLGHARGLGVGRAAATVVVSRALDFIVLVLVVLALSVLALSAALPREIWHSVLVSGVVVVLLIAAMIFLARGRLPAEDRLPERLRQPWKQFRKSLRLSPLIILLCALLTGLTWFLEAFRLGCVLYALKTPLEPGWIAVIALGGALLTTIPFTPGGLGAVEMFYAELLPRAGAPAAVAGAVVVLDRAINYWLILLIGAGVFLLQSLTRPSPLARRSSDAG